MTYLTKLLISLTIAVAALTLSAGSALAHGGSSINDASTPGGEFDVNIIHQCLSSSGSGGSVSVQVKNNAFAPFAFMQYTVIGEESIETPTGFAALGTGFETPRIGFGKHSGRVEILIEVQDIFGLIGGDQEFSVVFDEVENQCQRQEGTVTGDFSGCNITQTFTNTGTVDLWAVLGYNFNVNTIDVSTYEGRKIEAQLLAPGESTTLTVDASGYGPVSFKRMLSTSPVDPGRNNVMDQAHTSSSLATQDCQVAHATITSFTAECASGEAVVTVLNDSESNVDKDLGIRVEMTNLTSGASSMHHGVELDQSETVSVPAAEGDTIEIHVYSLSSVVAPFEDTATLEAWTAECPDNELEATHTCQYLPVELKEPSA